MDMKCDKCSEPWDWFYIRDDVLRDEAHYQAMKRKGGFFKDEGYLPPAPVTNPKLANWQFNPGPTIAQCPCCIGEDIEPDEDALIRAELAHLYGDDIDGFMADMEDFGL